MFDKEKFTPEFYDKLSDSEKKELVQVMLEDQLTDPLHIKGLPKPVQNCIKSAVKSSAKNMKEETMVGYLDEKMMKKIYDAYRLDTQEKIDKFNEAVRQIISDKDYFGDDDDILKHIEGVLNPMPVVTTQRALSSKYFLKNDSIHDTVREEMFEKFVCHRPTHVCDRYGKMWIDSLSDSPYKSCDTFLIHPRGEYKLFWLKTYLESKGFQTHIWIEPLTTFQLDEVIYWINPHVNYLEDINVKDSNILYYALDELVNYNDLDPISQMIVDSLKAYGPEMMKQGKLVGPNFNEDKKRLEKVIKKGRKKKMTNRQKEDKLMKSLSDPTENHSEEISKLITSTIRSKHHVYLATDWHLWKRKEKGKPECTKCSNFDEIFKNVNGTVTEKDLLIYMGDLVDGEFKDKEALKSVLLTIPCKKILVKGNNDLFDTSFYKSCGFEYVVQSFVWSDILFCHVPSKNNNQLNIHGHIHSSPDPKPPYSYPPVYWIDYTNQIDVAWCGGRVKPIELNKVISEQRPYSKHIKVDYKHMQEGYDIKNTSFFDSIFEEYVQDPFEE